MAARRSLLCGLILCGVTAAEAHRIGPPNAAPDGISIPSLTHGQMAVIARNLSAIRALADAQFPTDPLMRRLQGYVNLQSFACLWGLAPASVTDENSPFNECAHAYLAGARALLMHLREMPGDRRAVDALVAKIETEMLANNAALTLCRYSDEPFNTSEILWPQWRAVPFHAPTALMFSAVFLALGAAAAGLARLADA
jgi:hypothetical protein